MTDELKAVNDQLQQQVDELSEMVDLLQRAVAALQNDPSPVQKSPDLALVTDDAGDERLTPRDLHPAAPVTERTRRHLLKLAGGAAVAAVAGTAMFDRADPAAATTGDTMLVGYRHFAANMTRINNGSGLPVVGNALTGEKTLFWADNRASALSDAVGVRGDGLDNGAGLDGYGGTGVRGTGISSVAGSGTGVAGGGDTGVRGSGAIVGVSGIGSGPAAFGLGGVGTRAALLLASGTGSQPPNRTDAHSAGEIDIDANGTAWLCVKDGTPGTWRKIGGANTAGAFHAIPPVRAFDSRWAGNTRLGPGQSKVVSVADAHDLNGVVTTADVVPPGATAIAYNLTVTRTSGQGFLSANPGDATTITSSSINWFGENQDIANGLIVALDGSRQIKVFFGGGGSTDFIVDVTGYYR